MRFKLSGKDNKGLPTHVCLDDGFMQSSRKFNIEEDGWMLDQINPQTIEAVKTGQLIESLVHEINELRKENFRLKKHLKQSDEMIFGRNNHNAQINQRD